MTALWGLAFALICVWTVSLHSTGIIVTAAAAVSANDGSVLQALLESQYSEWMELVERAQMLHPLEQLVGSGGKLTIFAPQNHQLHAEMKSFVLRPSNAHLLKKMVEFHVLLRRVGVSQWRDTTIMSLAGESITLRSVIPLGSSNHNVTMYVEDAEIVAPDVIVRADGVVHGVDQMLLPMSVQREYVAFTTGHLATPLPTGAPVLDTKRSVLAGHKGVTVVPIAVPIPVKTKPMKTPVSAPSPFLAPAPGPGQSGAPWYDLSYTIGEKELTFISALRRFGGYEEFAGLVVEMTSLGSEISRLVNQGRRLTILAPKDEAWQNALTAEQLSSPTELENILHYHVIAEYHTEESLYSTLRRNGRTLFETMRVPLQLSAHEIDGLVVFGEGDMLAGVFDHDIHADGRISVQGVDKVLIPSNATVPTETSSRARSVLEMLQLPSRKSFVRSAGPRRIVTGGATIPAVLSMLVRLIKLWV